MNQLEDAVSTTENQHSTGLKHKFPSDDVVTMYMSASPTGQVPSATSHWAESVRSFLRGVQSRVQHLIFQQSSSRMLESVLEANYLTRYPDVAQS